MSGKSKYPLYSLGSGDHEFSLSGFLNCGIKALEPTCSPAISAEEVFRLVPEIPDVGNTTDKKERLGGIQALGGLKVPPNKVAAILSGAWYIEGQQSAPIAWDLYPNITQIR